MPDGSVKLGFRAHYPQLETKLTARGRDMDDIRRKLEPVEREVRKRVGNFILAEDDQTLEGVILRELAGRQATLALVETFTSGQMAARLAHLPGAETIFRRGVDRARRCPRCGPRWGSRAPRRTARSRRRSRRRWPAPRAPRPGATHALAVLIDLDDGPDRIEFGGTICLAIATAADAASRRPASWAAASGSASARSRWGSTACAATSRACRCTSASTSRRRERPPS